MYKDARVDDRGATIRPNIFVVRVIMGPPTNHTVAISTILINLWILLRSFFWHCSLGGRTVMYGIVFSSFYGVQFCPKITNKVNHVRSVVYMWIFIHKSPGGRSVVNVILFFPDLSAGYNFLKFVLTIKALDTFTPLRYFSQLSTGEMCLHWTHSIFRETEQKIHQTSNCAVRVLPTEQPIYHRKVLASFGKVILNELPWVRER